LVELVTGSELVETAREAALAAADAIGKLVSDQAPSPDAALEEAALALEVAVNALEEDG
jgi:hypothetical protein